MFSFFFIKATLASSQTDLSLKRTSAGSGSDAPSDGGKQATWVLPQMSDANAECTPSAASCQWMPNVYVWFSLFRFRSMNYIVHITQYTLKLLAGFVCLMWTSLDCSCFGIITSKFADLMKHPASDEPTIDIVLEKSLIHQTLLMEAQSPGCDQDLFHSFTVLFLLVWRLWYLTFFRLFDSCVQHMIDLRKYKLDL